MVAETTSFDARAETWDEDPMKTARAEAVAAAMRAGARWQTGMRGLEFGCGTGLLSFALRDRFEAIIMADTSAGMLDVLRRKIARTDAVGLAPRLLEVGAGGLGATLAGERVDMIFSLMTLHHVPDTDGILAQFADALPVGGQLCIADLDAEDGSFHGHDPSVHNGFDRGALERQLVAAGFGAVRFSTVFSIAKGTPVREYPVFLMIAEKIA